MQEENIDEVAKRFRIQRFGYIATGYTDEQEDAIYRASSKILASKYGHIISEEELYSRIVKQGHIYTLKLWEGKSDRGFLEKKTGNIGIPYFLRGITENIIHEIVHRIRI